MNRPGLSTLTRAEQEVIAQLVHGLSNKDIALALGKSASTIKNQIGALLKKTRCKSRLQLVVRCLHAGGIPPAKVSGTPRSPRLGDLWCPEFLERAAASPPVTAGRRHVA